MPCLAICSSGTRQGGGRGAGSKTYGASGSIVPANAAAAEEFAAAQAGGGAAAGVLQDSSFLTGLDERLARPFLVGFSEAMDLVFLTGAAVMVVGFVIMLFLPHVELRKSSSYGQRAEDDAAEAAEAADVPVTAPH